MRKIYIFLLALFVSFPAAAQVENTDGYMPSQGLQPYFDESNPNYDKSIIYVFFNNQPCYECAQAVEMIEQSYNQNFIDTYNMFLINYENDGENNFIETYQLSQPLEVVMVRVDDDADFGYKKIEGLQNMTTDPTSFNEYFVEQVNNFLNN